ncbi:MAG: hypothetical protein F6K19_30440 [Cyanothece sp. SIO1E1]|nr:hypothetical protein [Cyanothece sp. SIO1E1]
MQVQSMGLDKLETNTLDIDQNHALHHPLIDNEQQCISRAVGLIVPQSPFSRYSNSLIFIDDCRDITIQAIFNMAWATGFIK